MNLSISSRRVWNGNHPWKCIEATRRQTRNKFKHEVFKNPEQPDPHIVNCVVIIISEFARLVLHFCVSQILLQVEVLHFHT